MITNCHLLLLLYLKVTDIVFLKRRGGSMKKSFRIAHVTGFLTFLALLFSVSIAAVPAGYAGTPFTGTAYEIPGRIDFENYDIGGRGITWKQDNVASYPRGSDPEQVHCQIYHTSENPNEIDRFEIVRPFDRSCGKGPAERPLLAAGRGNDRDLRI
jgi:hypothetical protein